MNKDELTKQQKGNIIPDVRRGPRYPTSGFFTSGTGLSDVGFPPHPYETFAFDEALLAAKIQDFNIVPYSSVLPLDCTIVGVGSVIPLFFHGAVLEVIMAGVGVTYSKDLGKRNIGYRSHGRNYALDSEGPVMAAASCLGQLTEVTDKNGKLVGGYMAEYVGVFETYVGEDAANEDAHTQINKSMDNMLSIRNYDKSSGKRHIYPTSYVEVTEANRYGYTLSAIGFMTFKDVQIPLK